MRRLMIIVLFSILPLGLLNAAQTAPSVAQMEEPAYNNRLMVVGAGAIVGIVVFNMLTAHIGSVPFVAAPLDPTPKDIALGSRVLASLVGGAGALIAHYLYEPDGESR